MNLCHSNLCWSRVNCTFNPQLGIHRREGLTCYTEILHCVGHPAPALFRGQLYIEPKLGSKHGISIPKSLLRIKDLMWHLQTRRVAAVGGRMRAYTESPDTVIFHERCSAWLLWHGTQPRDVYRWGISMAVGAAPGSWFCELAQDPVCLGFLICKTGITVRDCFMGPRKRIHCQCWALCLAPSKHSVTVHCY